MVFSCLLPAKQIAGLSLLFYWSLFKIILFRCENIIRAIWVVPRPICISLPNQISPTLEEIWMHGWSTAHYILEVWHERDLQRCLCPAGTSQMLYPSPMTVAETVWCSNWRGWLTKFSRWMVCNVTHSFIFQFIGAEWMTRNTSWFHVLVEFVCWCFAVAFPYL